MHVGEQVSQCVCGVCAYSRCVGMVSGHLGRGLCPGPFLHMRLSFPHWCEQQPCLLGPLALGLSHSALWLCSGAAQCWVAVQTRELLSEGVPWGPVGSRDPGDCVFRRKPIYIDVGLFVPLL